MTSEELELNFHTITHHTKKMKSQLEYMIMDTPTGLKRNILCDINIHVNAIESLVRALQNDSSNN